MANISRVDSKGELDDLDAKRGRTSMNDSGRDDLKSFDFLISI